MAQQEGYDYAKNAGFDYIPPEPTPEQVMAVKHWSDQNEISVAAIEPIAMPNMAGAADDEGEGAYLNGERIAVSDRSDISYAILGFDLGYDFAQAKLLLEMLGGIWPRVSDYRLMGSSALSIAYAATGLKPTWNQQTRKPGPR